MASVGPSASPPPAGAGPAAFPGAVWVEREAEARKVLDFVLAAGSKLVILYGKHGVGKTALVRRWIMPLAAADHEAFYGDCAPELPDRVRGDGGEHELWTAAGRRALIFLDSFERLLDLPEARREELVAGLCARVRAPDCAATLVLVMDGDRLGRAFALRAPLAEVAQAAMEVKGVGTLDSVAALTTLAGQNALDCEPAVLEALAREAEALDAKVEGISPELLQVIGEELRRLRRGAQQPLGLQEYRAIGGLEDLLRGFLYRQIETLPTGGGPVKEVGIAILEEIAVARRMGRPPDFAGLPERLEMTGADLQKALAWLEVSGGLLRRSRDGGFELMPQGLAGVVEKEATRRRLKTKELQWILREGARAWSQLGTPLARETFERIDRHRHQLAVTDEEAELGLQGALRYQGEESLRGARYWLHRIRSEAARVDALLFAVFDSLPVVRAKAALLLGEFHQPEVRDQLYLLALKDPEPKVRDAAVQGLRELKNEALRDLLLQEARDADSPFRREAVNALKIFPEEKTVGVLASLVQDSTCPEPVRGKAIEVLAALQMAAAAEVLVDVALYDQDLVDRRRAAAGLGAWQAEILVRGCLEKLRQEGARPPRPEGPRDRLSFLPFAGRVAGAIAVGFANLAIHGLALLVLRRYFLGGLLLVTEAVAAALLTGNVGSVWFVDILLFQASLCAAQVIPAALLLRERRAGRLEAGSFQGLLAVPLYATSTLLVFSWLHGLAHALIGRWRRAGLLFLGEVVGLALWWGTAAAVANGIEAPILNLYSWLGLLLFWGTLVYDVVQVCRDSLLRNELAERRWEVYRQLLRGRVAPRLVLEQLASANRGDARWARSLLRRCGGEIDPALLLDHLREKRQARRFVVQSLAEHKGEKLIQSLCDLWSGAAPELQGTILTILARRPTEASLAALRRLRPDLDARQRLRVFWSPWQFRIRVWPRGALLVGALALPLFSWAVYEGISNRIYPYRQGIRVVQNEDYEDDEPRVATAEYLARVYPDQTVADLARVFRTTGEPQVRLGLAHSLKLIATKEGNLASGKQALQELVQGLERWSADAEVGKTIVDELVAAGKEAPGLFGPAGVTAALVRMLRTSDDLALRRAALQILEAAREVDSLRAVVLGAGAGRGEGRREGAEELVRQRRDEALRSEAIAALGRIGTLESIQALRDLAGAPLPESLAAQVRAKVGSSLQPLAAAYENGDYQQVRVEAQRLLAAPKGTVPRPELLNLLGKAECSLAQSEGADEARQQCIRHLEEARAAAGADEEARRLLAQSYVSEAEAQRAAGQFGEALKLTHSALDVDSSLASALGVQGVIYFQLRQPGKALAALNEAIRREPEGSSTYRAAKAAILIDGGRFEEAREELRAAIAVNPNDGWSFDLLRQSYEREGKLREAETELLGLKNRYPASRRPAETLALLYHEDLSRSDPEAYAKTLQMLAPLASSTAGSDPLLLANLAEAQLTAGRYPEAVQTAQKILAAPDLDVETRLNAQFIAYAAQVLLSDQDAARETLAALERSYGSLPADFRNRWIFEGTFRFLQASPLPSEPKLALLSLGELIKDKPEKPRAEEVFAANRAALE